MKHILWLIKQMIVLFIKGDFEGSKEAYWLIKFHLKYKSKRVDKKESEAKDV
jgi:hypothetical protein